MTGAPPPELAEIQAIIRGYQRSRAVTAAAELGIADLLAEGPRRATPALHLLVAVPA